MSVLDAGFLARAINGRWIVAPSDDLAVRGVSIDSRDDLAGRLFIALRGETHDGHEFIRGAIEHGASAIVVEREEAIASTSVPVLVVDSTRAALIELARAWRARLTQTTVIAVTGSCGKTTTKQLLDGLLRSHFAGTTAIKSFNNDIGVPLTILAADESDAFLLLEIGTNAPGEIEFLTRLARPHIGIITSIARVHLEGLGGLEGIALEKTALLRGLEPGGWAIVHGDSPFLEPHLAGLEKMERLIRFGEGASCHPRLVAHAWIDGATTFQTRDGSTFRMRLPGRHNALNALAAIAAARVMGVPDDRITTALAAIAPASMRFEMEQVAGLLLVNDAYNANPDAMRAALRTFAEIALPGSPRIVVLGEMLELGRDGERLHEELGNDLIELDRRAPINRAILIGTLMRSAAEHVRRAWGSERIQWIETLSADEAKRIASGLPAGAAVLLKGSRRVGVERIGLALRAVDSSRGE